LGEIIAIITGLLFWKYLSRPFRLVLILTVLGFICEISGYVITKFFHKHNAWIFNIYMPLEPLLLGIASIDFVRGPNYKKVVWPFLLINFAIWIFELYHDSIYIFASFSMICGCFLLVCLYISVLFKAIIFNNKILIKEPLFWLCLSIILYFGCDIPYMGVLRYWPRYKSSVHLTNINQILNFIRYPLVAVSFILAARQKKEELNSKMAYVSN